MLRKISGPEKGEVTKRGTSRSVLFTKCYSGDRIKKNEMGGARSTYGGRGGVHTEFWWRNMTETDHFEYVSVDGRVILNF